MGKEDQKDLYVTELETLIVNLCTCYQSFSHFAMDDLARSCSLLNDSIDKLNTNLLSITTNQGKNTSNDSMELLSTLKCAYQITLQIRDSINHIIQALQVEDMTTQLINSVSNKIKILDSISADAIQIVQSARDNNSTATLQMIEQIQYRISKVSSQLGRTPVQQNSLDQGDYEIF